MPAKSNRRRAGAHVRQVLIPEESFPIADFGKNLGQMSIGLRIVGVLLVRQLKNSECFILALQLNQAIRKLIGQGERVGRRIEPVAQHACRLFFIANPGVCRCQVQALLRCSLSQKPRLFKRGNDAFEIAVCQQVIR